MSREIKFRVWDNKNKEWLGASDNDVLIYYGFHLVGEVMTVQSPPQWALDDGNVVEQYTGLKDKNGKEIYEGDILDTPGGRCLCVWNGDGWTYQFKVHRTDWFDIVKEFHENSEVIGNIHENPELLEDKND